MDYVTFYKKHVEGLSKAGDWYRGWCPFHSDHGSKHKGFTLNPTNGLWKCYSECETAGPGWHNTVTFCEKMSLPIEESPDYDPHYRRYGYSGGSVHKKPHKGLKSKSIHDAWEGTKENRNKVPYNLEAIFLARKEKKPLWICEGAKDTETMLDAGELAVGIPTASSYKVMEGQILSDLKEVIIACDNDSAGKNAASKLKDMFPSAKVIVWPETFPQGFDVTDLKKVAEEKKKHFIMLLRRFARDDMWLDEADMIPSFLRKVKRGTKFYKTGFDTLDNRIGGLMPEAVHVIQGGSSIGKTTFCKQLADQVHEISPELPVFFFTLEDSLTTVLMIATMEPFHDRTMEPFCDRGYGATA